MPAQARKTRTVPTRTMEARTGMATPAEVGEYLQRSQQTLANWRWQGKGPKFHGKGRGLRYDWADVDEWVKGQPSGGEGVRRGKPLPADAHGSAA